MSDLRQARLGVVAVEPFQRLGSAAVKPRAARRAEALQQRLAHKRVDEGEPTRVASDGHEAGAQRRVEALEHGGSGAVEDVGERREPELAADHGSRAERFPRRLAERRQAAADRVANAPGQGQRAPAGLAIAQPALREEQLDELVDEEGVACTRAVQRLDKARCNELGPLRAKATSTGHRHLLDVLAAQALQRQPHRHRRQPAERDRQLVASVRFRVPVGSDRDDRRVGQHPDDELKRVQRRRVSPVQIIEHEDERLAPGRHREQSGERVEEAKPRLVGIEVGWRRG